MRDSNTVIGSLKVLDGVSATGVGERFSLGSAHDEFGLFVHGTGTTAATVQLFGAITSSEHAGTTAVWKQIGSDVAWDSTAAPVLLRISPTRNSTGFTPVLWLRATVSAFTTGTSTATDALSAWVSVI